MRGTLALSALLVSAGCSRANPAYEQVKSADAEGGGILDASATRDAAPAAHQPDARAADTADTRDVQPAPDVPADVPLPVAVSCPADPDLIGCFRFEGTVKDESPAALVVGTSVVPAPFATGPDGKAVDLGDTANIRLQETPALDPPRMTMEVWIRPRRLPNTGERMGILDNTAQYTLFLYPDGLLRCSMGGTTVLDLWTTSIIRAGTWSAVACTIDETTMTIWHDGIAVSSMPTGSPISPDGQDGLAIGANLPDGVNVAKDSFEGLMDNLRLWSRVRSAKDICDFSPGCGP